MTQIVDWNVARSTGAALAKTGPKVTLAEARSAVGQLRELSELAASHVREFTKLDSDGPHPPVRVVDRVGWINANVDGLEAVADPLLVELAAQKGEVDSNSIFRRMSAKSAGVQAGTVLAFLSGRVLGQFDVFSAQSGQLLLVVQNIVSAERKLGLNSRDFRLWVCLHEVCHRTQFSAVPWLRDYFFGQLKSFVEAGKAGGRELSQRIKESLDYLVDAVRNPASPHSLLDILQTPAQQEVVEKLLALMTVLEGHAEFVMDGVGPEVLPSVELIRARFNTRRNATNPVQAALRRLLGIELKIRQYAEGRRFVETVVTKTDMTTFNQVWTSPETLPSKAELADPAQWLDRVA